MSIVAMRTHNSNSSIPCFPPSNIVSRLTEHSSSIKNNAPTEGGKSKTDLPVVVEERPVGSDLKSPIYMKLEAMIETLAKVRADEEDRRVPYFEQAFIVRKRKEAAFLRREAKRNERQKRLFDRHPDVSARRISDKTKSFGHGSLLAATMQQNRVSESPKKTRVEVFKSYKVQDYNLPKSIVAARSLSNRPRVKFMDKTQ